MITLRSYQKKGADDIRRAFADGFKSPLFVAPTGSGKTVLFSYIADQTQQRSRRVCLMVHRAELIRQICTSLLSFDVSYGLIQSEKIPQPDKLTQVASVQTLVQRLDRVKRPDLLIIDECAHATAKSYQRIIDYWPDVPKIGFTATPARLDGQSLGDIFDHLILGPTVKDLTDTGFLAPAVYYCPPSNLHLEDVKSIGGDYDRGHLEALMDTPKITGDAVDHYRRICAGKPAVAFCTSIKHAEHVVASFRASGFSSDMIEGKMDERTRITRVRDLSSGKLHVLVSVDLISEGFDLPVITTALLLRPTQSLSLHLQQLGRPLRPYPGKKHAIILDHVGNCLRHGLAADPRTWSLETVDLRQARKNPSKVAIRQCPQCFRVFEPAPVCPGCGYIFPVQSRMIQEVAGDLVELSGEEMRSRQAKVDERERKERLHLEGIAKQRGYAKGWVAHILQARRLKRKTA